MAEAHKIIVNIEPHGYFTTNPDRMAEMQAFSDSPYLRLNMDTGNTFIAGQDPVKFLKRFINRVSHVHCKDVSESLAKALRGGMTGIAVSHCFVPWAKASMPTTSSNASASCVIQATAAC